METTESEVQLIHYLIELHKGKKITEIVPMNKNQIKACLEHVRLSSVRDRDLSS